MLSGYAPVWHHINANHYVMLFLEFEQSVKHKHKHGSWRQEQSTICPLTAYQAFTVHFHQEILCIHSEPGERKEAR